MKRMISGSLKIIRQVLDPCFMGDGRFRIWTVGPGLCRVFAAGTMHLEQLFCRLVPWLEHVVLQWPLRRDSVRKVDLAEVFLPETKQRRPINLRVSSDKIMQTRP